MIRIGDDVRAAMLEHARRSAPDECCGLLIGRGDLITRAVEARNLAADPTRRYVVDSHDHFAATRAARAEALEVVGAYHSHPRSAAIPSPSDAAGAFTDFIFVIIGLGAEPPEVTAWRWIDGNFDSVPLVRDLSRP